MRGGVAPAPHGEIDMNEKEKNDYSGCFGLICAIIASIGALSTEYLLDYFGGITIPFWHAGIIGLVSCEIVIPLAISIYMLVWWRYL